MSESLRPEAGQSTWHGLLLSLAMTAIRPGVVAKEDALLPKRRITRLSVPRQMVKLSVCSQADGKVQFDIRLGFMCRFRTVFSRDSIALAGVLGIARALSLEM